VILTRRGWLKCSDAQVGDETVGYNRRTSDSEWTAITAVRHYADVPLTRMGNSRWHAVTKPDHRWLNLPRVTVPVEPLPDKCPMCEWPNMPPISPPLSVCPECGWLPRAPGGVALHRRLKHGVKATGRSQRQSTFRRRGKSTEGGVRIHLASVHGIRAAPQQAAYATETEWITTQDIRSRDRLLIAAPARTESTLDVTVKEAAILGWIAGDGHVEIRRDVPRGRKSPSMSIAQSKPLLVEKLQRLLVDIPHADYVDERLTRTGKIACGPRHQFRLDHQYAQDLIRRAGHPKRDAVQQVLAMSTEQRDAWLEAMIDAEGHKSMRDGYTKPFVTISQTYGPVLEAITLAAYLDGHRPRVLDNKVDHPGWSPSASVHLNKPVVTGTFLTREDAGNGDVWCVTTELGTWTAQDGGHVFLTGD
jgi:hypothetical protein